jgi:predicted 3-demethylubiquinone-9 3-methyltransferase (glyoxalase superfamily)
LSIDLSKGELMPKVVPHLWFQSQAVEAVEFYVSVFEDSRVLSRTELPDHEGSVVRFELAGQRVVALNANSRVPYNEAFSFLIETGDQAETDYYYERLTAGGGKPRPCGWLSDKFGVYWQVIPRALMEMEADPDRERAARVLSAMQKMTKIIISDLERAYRG